MIWDSFEETSVKSKVLDFLNQNGFIIKQRTFYTHCNDGKLRLGSKGVYSKRSVKKYAESNLIIDNNHENYNLADKKIRAEIEKIETTNKINLKKYEILDGKYVEKTVLEGELASRAVILDNGLDYMIRSKIPEIIAIAEGDQSKAAFLLDFLLKEKDYLMNSYANMSNFKIKIDEKSSKEV